ncbi:MAG TPA: VOC family protein [Streptosporangiaceae bacterium]|nr:VOC family protein [Streptosporangiaceae bacterium]
MKPVAMGTLHHVEIWVPDLSRAEHTWGWLLSALGYELYQQWPEGSSWRANETYIVLEQSPARRAFRHDRYRPGMNHLAFHVSDRGTLDRMVGEALLHGWRLMFADRHPYAGGEHHYAAYLEDPDGYEVELVAPPPRHLADSADSADGTYHSAPDEPTPSNQPTTAPPYADPSPEGPLPGDSGGPLAGQQPGYHIP